MKVEILKLVIDINAKLEPSDAEKIRGYLGNLFWDNPYAHQHNADGSLIYKYPYIQYKVINGSCLLVGFNEGMEVIKKTFHDLKMLNLNGKLEEVVSKGLESYTTSFSIALEQIQYIFLTSWLALNKKNYETYQRLGTNAKRNEMLEKILVGNIISMSKGLRYTVQGPIQANIIKIKEVRTSLKGSPMLGFLGNFSVNFEIPDYWGIGKSVSRGFGTVKRV
ncbi:MAG: hypothetical protein DRJ64_00610 [Thermoprotei archaeon]|nr:MAG: hypothetical protein DRJ64_00610 [Thermoprotei archaeon]